MALPQPATQATQAPQDAPRLTLQEPTPSPPEAQATAPALAPTPAPTPAPPQLTATEPGNRLGRFQFTPPVLGASAMEASPTGANSQPDAVMEDN